MVMPCLHNSWIGGCTIYLTKLLKDIVITAQDLHKPTAFIWDYS